ncbi:MAG: DNA-formamidopyrimidine glycosylase [Mycoplasma sp.]|nr:DNA-formamidopyrimidine glycosylase [Mycoplasma sp.]
MPELPEVRVVSRALNEKVKNKVFDNFVIKKEKLLKEVTTNEFKKFLSNEKILDVSNIGKFIIFKISNNKVLLSHLRLEGKYFFYNKPTDSTKHTHLIFNFKDDSQLHYADVRMFGTFHIRTIDNYQQINPIKKLAAEPGDINVNDLFNKLQRKNIAIKTALLDQTLISGLGNIYVDEVLFATKIHPHSPSSHINKKQVEQIVYFSKKIMDESTKLGGSSIKTYTSINSKPGEYHKKLMVHTRVNQKCNVCGNTIIKTKTNGRGTYICLNCQIKY